MRASQIEFRLRVLIQIVIVLLGFWAPWIQAFELGRRVSLLEWLALEMSRAGLLRFTVAAPVVIVFGALIAAAGAVLRVWGTAYLGYATVHHASMIAGPSRGAQGRPAQPQQWQGGVVAEGPYRYVRNPLYLGTWCTVAAVALLMPPTGALAAMALETIFLLRLILGEEAFLAARLGEPYKEYARGVPRLAPRLRSNLPRASRTQAGNKPQWLAAFAGEIMPIGVFVTLAVLSWKYDNELMLKAILISFGASLVARAFVIGQTGSGMAQA